MTRHALLLPPSMSPSPRQTLYRSDELGSDCTPRVMLGGVLVFDRSCRLQPCCQVLGHSEVNFVAIMFRGCRRRPDLAYMDHIEIAIHITILDFRDTIHF